MKKTPILTALMFLLTSFLLSPQLKAQTREEKIFNESEEAKEAFIKTDAAMSDLFDHSYGYAIFPNVTKGAFIVGGAGAKGAVYENNEQAGTAKMIQVSVGLQAGGQTYREVIFFENKEALDRFKDNTIEFSGQVSAIAAKSNASANAKYTDGVQVYTQGKNGLMLEASVGGQKFKFTPIE